MFFLPERRYDLLLKLMAVEIRFIHTLQFSVIQKNDLVTEIQRQIMI